MKNARDIVSEAWHLTLAHRDRLFAFGFVPSFFSILVSAGYIFYQVQSFRHSHFFGRGEDHFIITLASNIWSFLSTSGFVFGLGIFFALLILGGWFFAPMLCRAAITHAISDAKNGVEIKKPLAKSFFQFFPLFTTTALKRGLEPTAFFTEWSFAARNMGTAAGALLSPFLIFFGILGSIALFFFAFTTQAIALKDKDFTGAISTSFKTIIANFWISLKLLLIFLLIELRVVINVLLVLLIPAILLGAGGFLAHLISPQVGFFLVGALSVGLVIVAAYLTGILFVLSEAIWTVAFLEFEAEKNAEE